MSKSRKQKGGDIPPIQFQDNGVDDALKTLHIDRKILPIIDSRNTKNVSVQERYYEMINTNQLQATMALGSLTGGTNTLNFTVPADPQTMISLPDSYFVVNLQVTANTYAGGEYEQNFAMLPFASKLFLNSVVTNINNQNCSDIVSFTGSYPYVSFVKQLLLRERQQTTYLVPPHKVYYPDGATALTANNMYKDLCVGQCSDTAGSEYISLGLGSETVDDSVVVPGAAEVPAGNVNFIKNHNACWYKNLMLGAENNQQEYDPANFATMSAAGAGNIYKTQNIELIIRPDDGIWLSQSGYLPTSTQLDITLKINGWLKFMSCVQFQQSVDPAVAAVQPTVSLTGMTLFVNRVRLTDDSFLEVNRAINEAPFIYNVLNAKAFQQTINASATSQTVNIPSCMTGVVPNLLAVMIVNLTTYNQDVTATDCHPFSCGRKRKIDTRLPLVQKMWCMAGSKKYPISNEYLCNNSALSQQYITSTYDEYKKCCLDSDKPFLTYEHWRNHYTVYFFNLCNDHPLLSATDETRTGSVSLHIVFDQNPALQLIGVGLFHSQLSINNNRNVSRINFD